MADGASVYDPIEHVVVLMLENHSFDNILGSLASINPQINGFNPAFPAVNYDKEGNVYPQTPVVHPVLKEDVPHDFKWVQMQINNGRMDGFVLAAEEYSKNPTAEIKATPMEYFPVGALPATHTLAQNFTICDNYFASVPSSTWPNRLFALSGTSKGWVDTPTDAWDAITHSVHLWDQPSLFQVLHSKGVSVRCYYGDAPLSTLLVNNLHPNIMTNYFKHGDHFAAHVAKGDLPQFTFIEPHYLGGVPTDNHPPHNFIEAEKLVAEVYNTLRSNEALWNKTLFVLTFDEHGGYFDHVIPPLTVAPDTNTQEGFDFSRLGIRIPVILMSPWVDGGMVDHTLYDHTSLIKYLLEKWNVPLDSLGKRALQANSLRPTVLYRASQGLPPRTDTPLKIEFEDNVHPDTKNAIDEYVKQERDADIIGNNKLFEMFAALTHNLDKSPSPTHFMYNVTKFLKLPGIDRWTHACNLWDHHVDHNGGNKPR